MIRRRNLYGAAALAAALFVGIQFVPVDRTNPAPVSPVVAPPAVVALLDRACFDCHSHRTRWPWYSRVAPVAWWVAQHVEEGRGDLNFDVWPVFDAVERELVLRDIEQQLVKGEMPPASYEFAHPAARLSPAEMDVLLAWSRDR
jgi:hypothetical protein